MAPEGFAERVVRLEQQMVELRELPEKVEDLRLQIVQLRSEMRDEFSAMHAETRRLIQESEQQTGRQMRVLHEEVLGRIALLHEGLAESSRRKRRHSPPRE